MNDPANEGRLSFRNVSKTYATRQRRIDAVVNVNLDLKEHEFVSIVGPSGCGKTTLMMMASGLIPCTAGAIYIGGRQVTGPFTDVGIVFQQDLLLPWRTALQNVMLPCEIRGLDARTFQPRALDLLALAGLGGFENEIPRSLSGGMRQRVAICRALVYNAPLLLMDEPFGFLDALTREQMNIDLLRIWDRERQTVLLITHSISEAIFLSDRIVVMSPNPGSIKDIIDVKLPRPRQMSSRDSAPYEDRIRALFQDMGLLQDRRDTEKQKGSR